MRRLIGFFCLAAVAVALGGCDVQLQDETPGTFTANPDIGMYPLTVKVTSGALVSTPIYVFVVGADGQQVPLSAGPNGAFVNSPGRKPRVTTDHALPLLATSFIIAPPTGVYWAERTITE